MKTNTYLLVGNPFRVCGFQSRAAALVASVAISACIAVRLDAVVLDDFSAPSVSETYWSKGCNFGACGHVFTNGQARLSVTPSGDNGFAGLNSPVGTTWTVQEGRTLEFRVDLISSSGDGAVARLVFGVGNPDKYALNVDQDTIVLLKREDPIQLFFRTNGPTVKVTNVKLVLSMTGGPESSVWLQWKILDNDQAGRVLFEGSQWDTAGAEPMVAGSDYPPGSYLGRSGRFNISVYHDNAALFDPNVEIPHLGEAVVVFDNAEVLEYDVPAAEIANSVLLSWSNNTAEEQIVVAADSLASNAVWTPWPEPIFKRHGQPCMAVPTTVRQLFFKLVPGTQFADDFSEFAAPFAPRIPYVPGFYSPTDASRWDVALSNAVLRVQTLSAPADPQGRLPIRPPGLDVEVEDFWAAVDLLNFNTALDVGWFGIGARLSGDTNWPGVNNGYIGGVAPHADGRNMARLNLFDGSAGHKGDPFTYKPGTPYRLIFSGVGHRLSVELIDLFSGKAAVAPLVLTDFTFSRGMVIFWIQAGPGQTSCEVSLDNFFVTGTKPE